MAAASIILLTLLWIAVTGSLTVANFVLGAVVAGATIFVLRHHLAAVPLRRPVASVALLAMFVVELLKSGWRVAWLVCQPRPDLKPGVLLYRTNLTSDFEVTLLANLITLTPGTLTIDVLNDRRTLVVHAIDCSDPDQTRAEIRDGFERAIRQACAS